MANYPTVTLDNDSIRTPVNMTEINVTASGSIRGRNYQSTTVYEFRLKHSYITQAEAESIFSTWESNKTAAVNLTYAKDSETYSVYFAEPPTIDLIRGSLWYAESKLIGTLVP